jgi:hypothetical protein
VQRGTDTLAVWGRLRLRGDPACGEGNPRAMRCLGGRHLGHDISANVYQGLFRSAPLLAASQVGWRKNWLNARNRSSLIWRQDAPQGVDSAVVRVLTPDLVLAQPRLVNGALLAVLVPPQRIPVEGTGRGADNSGPTGLVKSAVRISRWSDGRRKSADWDSARSASGSRPNVL